MKVVGGRQPLCLGLIEALEVEVVVSLGPDVGHVAGCRINSMKMH